MLVLAIESSCDETGAAVISDGRYIFSNVVASQADLHNQYGGVVPEVASRQQLAAIIPVIQSALQQAGTEWSDLDAVAATYGPGLAGPLLIGLTAAKTVALAHNLPFIGVNHLEAHIYANWLREEVEPQTASRKNRSWSYREGDPKFPILALVVSGGHTELVLARQHGQYELLGQTLDDAAGEAFDKVARLLGLGYPGGPAIQRAANERRPNAPIAYKLPRAWLKGTYNFSFSGLKTAVLNMVEGSPQKSIAMRSDPESEKSLRHIGGIQIPELAAAFQESVIDVLVKKTVDAAQQYDVSHVLLAGGVAANNLLRKELQDRFSKLGMSFSFPAIHLCTDNAAMIGSAAYFYLSRGLRHGMDLDVQPNLHLPYAS